MFFWSYLQKKLKIFFNYVYVCVWACMNAGVIGLQKRMLEPLELELLVVMSCLVWVMVTKRVLWKTIKSFFFPLSHPNRPERRHLYSVILKFWSQQDGSESSSHQVWWLEFEPRDPYSWRRKLYWSSFPLACPCVFVTTYFLTGMQNKNVKFLDEN